MIVIQIILSILALWLLYHLMMWALPLAAGIGLGYLAFQHGSGWLVAIGMGFIGMVIALAILHLGMAARSLWIRLPVILAFVGPAAYAGAAATYGMAIQTGAQGPVWPVVASIGGGLVFAILAFTRLLTMTGQPAPAAQPAMPAPVQGEPFSQPEPTVVYYHPIEPVRPRLSDERGSAGRTIDL